MRLSARKGYGRDGDDRMVSQPCRFVCVCCVITLVARGLELAQERVGAGLEAEIGPAGDEIVPPVPAAAIVVVVVDDDDAALTQPVSTGLEAEFDRVVPVAVDMHERDAADIRAVPGILEQALVEHDMLA